MLSSFLLKLIVAFFLLAYAPAFAPISNQPKRSTALNIIPITNGPTLNKDQAKAAGIGGIDGINDLKSGGMGAFGVKSSSKKNNAKKAPAVNAKKAAPAKKPAAAAETKKSVNLFTKMPWSK